MKKAFFLVVLVMIGLIFFKASVFAKETTDCSNRYATLINPVRGRDLWIDKTISPLQRQYSLIKQYNFPATWLLQYDTLLDQELLDAVKKFDENQEKGVFLEISQRYADDARVIYPYLTPWYSPKAVFLSAYTQSERLRLIDRLFQEFKIKFGYYPQSVGAWWIDSYSLNYMKEKYNIKAAMIVADQKTTDNYGVWGQWWGVPYYPSKANILTPVSNLKNKQDVVIIQWAQRDPVLAYGEGSAVSNYSLQANDYIRQKKDTTYFTDLVNIYLDCKNPIGQITIGLETGSDSVIYLEEYKNQLEVLNKMSNLRSVTMEQFYEKFSKEYPEYPKKSIISKEDFLWVMTPQKRINKKLNDVITYNSDVSFDDYFVAKKDDFLNRVLSIKTEQTNSNLPFGLITLFISGLYAYFKKKVKLWLISTLFILASFGLILRSDSQFGWWVYYGSFLHPLYLYQLAIPIVSFLIFLFLSKFRNLNLWLMPLTFGFDPLVQSFRASLISEKYYFGFNLDALRFLGISLTKKLQLGFVNIDFPGYLAAGLLKVDYNKIWQNLGLALLLFPLVHIILGVVLNISLKRSSNFKYLIFLFLTFFLLLHLWKIFSADPTFVAPKY